ncbi:MAG: hypothetical protein LBH79_00825 [Nitrososphaerota archaeon]|jgi:hypothetical protein|nr:hypothetical protein [Nitrososphaerota archaeon]
MNREQTTNLNTSTSPNTTTNHNTIQPLKETTSNTELPNTTKKPLPAQSPQPSNTRLEALKQAAAYWHNQGLAVFPIATYWNKQKEKWGKNLCYRWQKWQTEPQTPSEFNSINWQSMLCRNPKETDPAKRVYDPIDGFALVITRKANNGCYLRFIDYDPKGEASIETKALGKNILAEILQQHPTLIEGTINGGTHAYYWSLIPCDYNPNYSKSCCLELLGGERCTVVTPTTGYQILNTDMEIAQIDDLQTLFISAMKRHKVPLNKTLKSYISSSTTLSATVNTQRLSYSVRPCTTVALKQQLGGSLGHSMRLNIAAKYLSLGVAFEHIVELFKDQNDFDRSTTLTQVDSVAGHAPHTCESILSYGYCLYSENQAVCSWRQLFRSNKKTGKKDSKEQTSISVGFASSDFIFEQCYTSSQGSFYMVYNRVAGRVEEYEHPVLSVRVKDVTYVPLISAKSEVSPLLWPACTSAQEYTDEVTLFYEVRGFIYDHLDVPNDLDYDVFALYVMATWRLEDFVSVPYYEFLGVKETGKTRGLECFKALGYRPLMVASISVSAVFRIIEEYHPLLLLDEMDNLDDKEASELIKILNAGYKKGQYAVRSSKDVEGGFVPEAFDVFGFKVLAGTKLLPETVESRCIKTAMSKAVRRVEVFVDEGRALRIRNKLLMYRFRTLGGFMRG